MSFPEFLASEWQSLLSLTLEHAYLTLAAVAIATVIAVVAGTVVFRLADRGWTQPRQALLATTGVFLTIPSFALFGLFIPLTGLGFRTVLIPLVMYSLLPIVRNTITGLEEVDSAVVESARGMGMSGLQRLVRIELPMAWPVILTGIRVATLLTVGIAAIGAVVNGPGLGGPIFDGLSRLGGAGAVNDVLAGTLGTALLAMVFDLAFQLVGTVTTSRGIR